MGAVQEVAEALTAMGLTLATAESTTGGYIGHLLNSLPGSSKYFPGGVIAYNSWAKTHVLKVPEPTLQHEGSVSIQTALAMAEGVRDVMNADIGVAETGIAGPSGGSPDMPVGTVFIAISTRDGYQLGERFVWATDRAGFKERTADAVFDLILHYLRRQEERHQK